MANTGIRLAGILSSNGWGTYTDAVDAKSVHDLLSIYDAESSALFQRMEQEYDSNPAVARSVVWYNNASSAIRKKWHVLSALQESVKEAQRDLGGIDTDETPAPTHRIPIELVAAPGNQDPGPHAHTSASLNERHASPRPHQSSEKTIRGRSRTRRTSSGSRPRSSSGRSSSQLSNTSNDEPEPRHTRRSGPAEYSMCQCVNCDGREVCAEPAKGKRCERCIQANILCKPGRKMDRYKCDRCARKDLCCDFWSWSPNECFSCTTDNKKCKLPKSDDGSNDNTNPYKRVYITTSKDSVRRRHNRAANERTAKMTNGIPRAEPSACQSCHEGKRRCMMTDQGKCLECNTRQLDCRKVRPRSSESRSSIVIPSKPLGLPSGLRPSAPMKSTAVQTEKSALKRPRSVSFGTRAEVSYFDASGLTSVTIESPIDDINESFPPSSSHTSRALQNPRRKHRDDNQENTAPRDAEHIRKRQRQGTPAPVADMNSEIRDGNAQAATLHEAMEQMAAMIPLAVNQAVTQAIPMITAEVYDRMWRDPPI